MSKAEPQQDAESSYDDVSLESLGAHLFFGPVDEDKMRAACDFVLKSNLFKPSQKPVTLFINSPGGECADGFALIDVMETSAVPVATVGLGQIASMGVLIVSAGKHGLRTLTRNSEVMAHQFSGYFAGKQHELIATQTAYHMLERRFFQHFRRHSLMTDKQIKDVLFSPSDRYLTPAECKKYGLIDRVVDSIEIPKLARVSSSKR